MDSKTRSISLSEPLLTNSSTLQPDGEDSTQKSSFEKTNPHLISRSTRNFIFLAITIFATCFICWLRSVYDSVYDHKSWLTLSGCIVAFLALMAEYPSANVFLVLTSYFLLFNLISSEDALKGLSSPGMMAVGALQPIAKLLKKFGTIERILSLLLGNSSNPLVSFVRMVLSVSVLSAFLSNTAIVLICVSSITTFAERNNIDTTVFLIPLSYVSLLGGMCTLLGTSTNLVIKEISAKHVNIEMFTMLPLGVVCALLGFIVIIIMNINMLKKPTKKRKQNVQHKNDTRSPLSSLRAYDLKLKFQVTFELVESNAIKNTNSQSLFDLRYDSTKHSGSTPWFLVHHLSDDGIEGSGSQVVTYDTNIADATHVSYGEFLRTKLKPGDIVCFLCTPEGVVSLRHMKYLKIHRNVKHKGIFDLSRLDAPGRMHRRLFEVVPSPNSTLVNAGNLSGRNMVLQNRKMDKHDYVVLATRKISPGDTENVVANRPNYEISIEADAGAAGEKLVTIDDALLIEAHKNFLSDHHKSLPNDFAFAREVPDSSPPRQMTKRDTIKKYAALFVLLLMLSLVTAGIYHVFTAAVLALSFFVCIRLMDVSDIIQSINVDMMITLICSYSMASAVRNHSVDTPLQAFCMSIITNEAVFLGTVYFVSTILTNVISNNAAAILLWELFLDVALIEGFDTTRLALALIMGCSSAFLSPVGYQTNLIVQAASNGSVKNFDFFKTGFPLVLVLTVAVPFTLLYLY